jgi:homospermidine synthase
LVAVSAEAYERVFATPVGADLAALCGASGTPYTRVGDLDAYVEYVKKHFGKKLLRTRDVPAENYTNAFVGHNNPAIDREDPWQFKNFLITEAD